MDEKSRQTKSKDDLCAAFCFARAWQKFTFTNLCTSMWSGPTGLSNDTRFIMSSSKTQVVQLVKKFPRLLLYTKVHYRATRAGARLWVSCSYIMGFLVKDS